MLYYRQNRKRRYAVLTKSSLIADYILGEIILGRLAPGARLPSRNQLAREFNCSRTSVERAMAFLAASGNITSSRGSGTFVAIPKKTKGIKELRIVSFVSPFLEVKSFPFLFSDEGFPDLKIRWIKPNCIGENLEHLAAPEGAVVWIMPELSQLIFLKHLRARNVPQILINREFSGFDCITTDAAASISEGLEWLTASGRPVCLVAEEPKEWRPYQHGRLLAFFETAVKLQAKLLPESIHIAPYSTNTAAMSETGNFLWGRAHPIDYNIFIPDQELVPALLQQADKYGKKAGRDFQLLSFDTPAELNGMPGVAMLRQAYDLFSVELIRWIARGGTLKDEPFRVHIKTRLVINGK